VAADGVRLGEAPVAPSWGEVHIRIPSGQHCVDQHSIERHSIGKQGSRLRLRGALGDIHPSGDLKNLHAPNLRPGWSAHTAIDRMRISTALAECTTTGLIGQAGGDSGSRVAESGRQSRLGEPASWKDPL
jgi:hypothetical protein